LLNCTYLVDFSFLLGKYYFALLFDFVCLLYELYIKGIYICVYLYIWFCTYWHRKYMCQESFFNGFMSC